MTTLLPVLMAFLGTACVLVGLYATITDLNPRGRLGTKTGRGSVTGSELGLVFGVGVLLLVLSYLFSS